MYFHREIFIFHFHMLKVFLDKSEGLLIVFDYSLPKPNSKHLFIQVFLMRYSALGKIVLQELFNALL